ncbi:MAG TPA: hypothetical protein VGQ76_00075 [Thermoanaerobaculia bacterium]|jgi:hypothetical protein|nr:hypothetical protein [Thermoanaerobaculia bacterium]
MRNVYTPSARSSVEFSALITAINPGGTRTVASYVIRTPGVS